MPSPREGEVTVSLEYSAISAGTEKANYIGLRNGTDVSEDAQKVYDRLVNEKNFPIGVLFDWRKNIGEKYGF